eukprot:11531372-Alexandrium_andersonii.AAC.1
MAQRPAQCAPAAGAGVIEACWRHRGVLVRRRGRRRVDDASGVATSGLSACGIRGQVPAPSVIRGGPGCHARKQTDARRLASSRTCLGARAR